MTRTLLLRGMLVGVVAGLLVFAFARWIGEPQVERAIAFETATDQAKGEAPEPEMVSRRVQKSVGLLTGTLVFGAAVGGLFGLVFAFAYGRIGEMGPRALSAVLAVLGYVAVVLVPNLKYPANPPAVGNADTIGVRTGAYFLLIAVSIAAMVFSLQMRRGFAKRFGEWNGSLLAAALFVMVAGVASRFFPVVDEVPVGFPVTLMWKFRVAALEIQAVLWGTLGLGFGWLTEREFDSGRVRGK
jgi:predicted cobalt transporter CbtA